MQATIRVREEALAVVRSGLQMKRNALERNLRQYQEGALGFEQQHGMTSSRFTERFSIHFMTATDVLVARWDSAPHYPLLPTFPFHKHTVQGVEAHPAVTLLEVLDEVVAHLAV